MNELLLAIRSSYNNITARPTSSEGKSSEGLEDSSSYDNIASFQDIPNIGSPSITPPSVAGVTGVASVTSVTSVASVAECKLTATVDHTDDTISDVDLEVDGNIPAFEREDSPLASSGTSHHLHSEPAPQDNLHSAATTPEDDIFTPRTRKKWSQCTNSLFFSYRDNSSSDSEDDMKETSIDGIFIKFDDNIPKIVDKKRCSHISALARVTCVHHRPPKFVKRRAASLKSKSWEKMRDTKSSNKNRPFSAGSAKKRVSEPNKPTDPKILKHSLSLNNQAAKHQPPECLDPLRVYLQDRKCKSSLSESTESYHDTSEASEQEREGSDKENKALPLPRERQFSVDEHFLEEGRFHLKESETELGTSLRYYRETETSLPEQHVPEDLYKAVQQRTPNDHIFVQYGSEVRRVVVASLPISLDKLLDKMVHVFNDSLTPDMVPLKAIYIQDAQTKIFYQLDDHNEVIKGSHLKIHEEFIMKNIDRGSSQSLEDLHNSSNSSLSSGGYVIPVTVNQPKPVIKRPGKSRLSLVEEKLSLITSEFNNIKSETGSTVSSQTDFGAQLSHLPVKQLHVLLRSLHQNLLDTKTELMTLKRRELESRAEMDVIVRETSEQITRHIQAALPKGIRRKRMEADEIEERYRSTSEQTYTNIKDLEKTVDVMKTDVVKRKVKLNTVQLEAMENELQSYTQQVTSMNSTFSLLKESLKKVMKEELEIIVNEEQFLEDEEPMLEDITIKCEELTKVMETLKKVAAMQKQQGSKQLAIFTASEYDILEERNSVIREIGALVPNHEERIQSIQATEEYRAVQKKFVKSESEFVAEEIQHKSQNLRKTNAFEELERKREAALKELYTAQPPPHKFGRKSSSQQQFCYSAPRRPSISKCKSMSSIINHEADNETFKFVESDNEPDMLSVNPSSGNNIKRSRSFSDKEKEKQQSSEDEKTKKKTMFAGFFSKKSKPKESKDQAAPDSADCNGDVFVVDTARIGSQDSGPPSPAVIPRSNTDVSRKNNKNKTKTSRMTSYNLDEKNRNKKGKNR